MAMRCCEEALLLRNDYAETIALWLAANIRRESRLGMNVESGDPDEVGEADETRPAVFPRALYFSLAAGPRYAHLVLQRAVRGNDSPVALGAIEALRITAGESSLVGTEDYKQPLVQALRFPDLLVRIRAAFALGAALPKSPFADAEFVTPVLAEAVTLTGREQVLVVDSDERNLNRVMEVLREGGRDVIGDTNFYRALERTRTEFHSLAGLFISTDVTDPAMTTALAQLRSEFTYTKTPVVLLAKPRQSLLAEQVASADGYAEAVDAAADGAALEAGLERVRSRTGRAPLDHDLASSLALQAAETLRSIAVDGRTVYDFGVAEPALIAALSSDNEELQITAASVLALARTPTAQRSIAEIALDSGQPDSLRVSAFNSLAESAKHNGKLLEERQVAELVEIARDDPDLTIRTAASEALGGMNLAAGKAGEIIRSYHGG
jgi:HEAT repeat protein